MELRSTNMLQEANSSTQVKSHQDQILFKSSQDVLHSEKKECQITGLDLISSNKDESKTNASGSSPLSSQINSSVENPQANPESTSKNCMQFDVPLPLVSQVRNAYTEILRKNRDKLSPALKDNPLSQSQIIEIDTILDNLQQLCDYSSLIPIDHLAQQSDVLLYQAKYAENISTKIIFVTEFLSIMEPHGKTVMILIRQELIDVFEAIFNSRKFSYRHADCPDNTYKNIEKKKMTIILAPTSAKKISFEHTDIVIAFNSNYYTTTHFESCEKAIGLVNPSIVLHLIISHSVEHLERILNYSTDHLNNKLKLINLLYSTDCSTGILPRGYPEPPEAAKLIANYLLQDNTDFPWPLPTLPEIEINLKNIGDERATRLPGLSDELPGLLYDVTSRASTPIKRLFETSPTKTVDSPKRQKTKIYVKTKSLEVNSRQVCKDTANYDLTRFEDEIEASFKDELDDETTSELNMNSRRYIYALKQKLMCLKTSLKKAEEMDAELRRINQDLESRCLDIESSLTVIQPKFQEALNDRGLFEYEKNLAIRQEKATQRLLEVKDAEILKVREENETLMKELKSAREALSNSTLPGVAEMEKMREEISTLKENTEILHKQKKSIQSDYDYLQSNYQTASTSAASLAQQILSQKKEIMTLKMKASDNAVRIHQIQRDNTLSKFQATIKNLRAEKLDLERQFEKLSEHQYTAAISGRPNTRGNSVPRSPRPGTRVPSPKPISRVISGHSASGSLGGNGSRGNSPASTLEPSVGQPGIATNVANNAEVLHGNTQRRTEKPNLKRFGTHLQ